MYQVVQPCSLCIMFARKSLSMLIFLVFQTGCLGFCGREVDQIDYYQARISELERKVSMQFLMIWSIVNDIHNSISMWTGKSSLFPACTILTQAVYLSWYFRWHPNARKFSMTQKLLCQFLLLRLTQDGVLLCVHRHNSRRTQPNGWLIGLLNRGMFIGRILPSHFSLSVSADFWYPLRSLLWCFSTWYLSHLCNHLPILRVLKKLLLFWSQ